MKPYIFLFANLFALSVGGMMLALRYLDRQDKQHISKMLGGTPQKVSVPVDLLRDLKESGGPARRALQSIDIGGTLEDLLQQADLNWPVARFVQIVAMASVAGMVAGAVIRLGGNRPLSMLVFALLGASLPYFHVRRLRGKRMAALEKQLPDAMDFLARSMKAGHAFSMSIGMVGDDLPEPLGREFRSLFNEQNLGASLEGAFANLQRRIPLSDIHLFCSAAILQRRTGGNLSEVLMRLSELVRDRFRLRGQVKAASAHGRMTAGILTAMPILTMLGLVAVAPNYLKGMWDDEDGRKLLGGAVVCQVLGNMTIQKIVRIKV